MDLTGSSDDLDVIKISFKVFDTKTGDWIRNEFKLTMDMNKARRIEKKYIAKAQTMGWLSGYRYQVHVDLENT